MVNIVKKDANSEIDFPTLERYKEVYPLLLSNYLDEYEDNTEKRFIELQIEHFKTYCDEFLNNPKYTFNKYEIERLYTSRLLVIEYLENKLIKNEHYKIEKDDSKKGKKELIFHDFISKVKNKEAFADDLKITFDTQKGIDFKIMIELLKEEKIFLIGDGKFKAFYEACKKYFGRDIGSRTALNDLYKHSIDDKKRYSANIEIIVEKLNPLILKHKL